VIIPSQEDHSLSGEALVSVSRVLQDLGAPLHGVLRPSSVATSSCWFRRVFWNWRPKAFRVGTRLFSAWRKWKASVGAGWSC